MADDVEPILSASIIYQLVYPFRRCRRPRPEKAGFLTLQSFLSTTTRPDRVALFMIIKEYCVCRLLVGVRSFDARAVRQYDGRRILVHSYFITNCLTVLALFPHHNIGLSDLIYPFEEGIKATDISLPGMQIPDEDIVLPHLVPVSLTVEHAFLLPRHS